ncbi:unnamed protein product [Protopolystoma xenopodis]|uniref:Uncharacterized protein n=1 Tax=Protopolystoma xenopodis TaxID=117903 RepID=A0A448XQ73_9PLAT|nr:unnamed protein product [Protopolystoma xenopodis]
MSAKRVWHHDNKMNRFATQSAEHFNANRLFRLLDFRGLAGSQNRSSIAATAFVVIEHLSNWYQKCDGAGRTVPVMSIHRKRHSTWLHWFGSSCSFLFFLGAINNSKKTCPICCQAK